MYLKNNNISDRQSFRMGMLENMAIPMMLTPYVAVRLGGGYHLLSVFIGVILISCYSLVIYGFSTVFADGMAGISRCTDIIYAVRFYIRAALVIWYFSTVVKKYMLTDMSYPLIILIFLPVVLYGAAGGIEKRGRLFEVIFLWVMVPLLIIGISSANNMRLREMLGIFTGAHGKGISLSGIALGGYGMLMLASSVELLLFSLVRCRENSRSNFLKILIWLVLAVVTAYVVIIGTIGSRWAGSEKTSAFDISQSIFNYFLMVFWVVGIFANVSGYVHYANEFLEKIVKEKGIKISFISAGCLAAALLLWAEIHVARVLFIYICVVDLWISILIPFVIYLKGYRGVSSGRHDLHFLKSLLAVLCIAGAGCLVCGCSENKSIEDRDYASELTIHQHDEGLSYTFFIANLEDYQGDTGKRINSIKYSCDTDSIYEAVALYGESEERQLDVGHLKKIVIEGHIDEKLYKGLLSELRENPNVQKTIIVDYQGESMSLLDAIKRVF